MKTTKPFALLTIRRIAALTRRTVSHIQCVLDDHPEIQPTAVADYQPVFDRVALLSLLSILDHHDESDEATADVEVAR